MNPGDIVQLKSGGPALTVIAEEGETVRVLFFSDEIGEFREATLPAFALEPVEFEDPLDAADLEDEEDELEDEEEEEEQGGKGAKRKKG